MWKEKLNLRVDESLRHERSYEKGNLGQEEISLYSIISTDGEIVGTVKYTELTALKGFRRSFHLIQHDKAGKLVVDERWSE